MLIGICGKSGSGKSTLAKKIVDLKENKYIHLDIDKIGHKVLEIKEVQKDLINTFGNNIIENNKVNRKKLSNIVFSSKEQMQKLTNITWGYMQIEIDKIINKNLNKTIILDWQLLPLTKYFELCTLTILIDIPYQIRKERVLKRDNITEEQFQKRENASLNLENIKFDYIINNNYEEIIKILKNNDKIIR